jgi:CubicO group peptidase (beta-lactamase class C family)
MAEEYRNSFEPGALLEHLATLREAGRGGTDQVAVRPRPDGSLGLVLGGSARFVMRLDEAGKLTRLELAPEGEMSPRDALRPQSLLADGPLTWDRLGEAFRTAEAAGFSGVALARRGGEEVLRESYGKADRRTGRDMTTGLVFGIGSTPIDFTVSVTRILAARGALELDDPIGHHLSGVPEDKEGMTIRHILEGRSGLPDFHHTAADWDPDLAWIDRPTAVQRILGQPLLFEPGADEAHSHSAFVLLAAILETVADMPYPEIVRMEILRPLGMIRTGFYGETLDLDPDDFAVGYGMDAIGLPNIPPNWGPTSWLIMGSGGMFSTLGDMDRYYRAVAEGILPGHEPGSLGPTALSGGSDRGYFILLADDGQGNSVLMLTNVEGPRSGVPTLARAITDLVLSEVGAGESPGSGDRETNPDGSSVASPAGGDSRKTIPGGWR